MKKRALAVLCAGCAVLVTGCAELGLPEFEFLEPAPWVQPDGPQPASNAESLLLYFQHLRKLPAADLGREHDVARQVYNRARSDFNRVRLALVLSLPNTPFNDDGRALELLESVAKNADGRLQGLALVLSSHLQEQKRLNASVQGLQQKLDALRSLERSMIERSR
jgi:hypothetical protein